MNFSPLFSPLTNSVISLSLSPHLFLSPFDARHAAVSIISSSIVFTRFTNFSKFVERNLVAEFPLRIVLVI